MPKAHVGRAAYSLKLQLDVGLSVTMCPPLHRGIMQKDETQNIHQNT